MNTFTALQDLVWVRMASLEPLVQTAGHER